MVGFTDNDRRVFKYECPPGSGVWVYADPLEVHFELIDVTEGAVASDWAIWCDEQSTEAQRAEAGLSLVNAARFAFALPEFNNDDGTGCTHQDCLSILEDYYRWMEGKDSRPDHSPTS